MGVWAVEPDVTRAVRDALGGWPWRVGVAIGGAPGRRGPAREVEGRMTEKVSATKRE